MNIFFALYPMTLETAWSVAKQAKVDADQIYIEPSRFVGYLFNSLSTATLFRVAFDAKHWPTTTSDLTLLYVERSSEVSDWIASCNLECEPVEIAAVLFASGQDQLSFEKVIWPCRKA